MATSSFQKNFAVKGEEVIEKFVEEMSKEVTPKLRDDFKSGYTDDENVLNKIKDILK